MAGTLDAKIEQAANLAAEVSSLLGQIVDKRRLIWAEERVLDSLYNQFNDALLKLRQMAAGQEK